MAAFVSESPATYDQLPFPSCSLLIWQILMVFLLTPYFPPSCHLCAQVFSSLVMVTTFSSSSSSSSKSIIAIFAFYFFMLNLGTVCLVPAYWKFIWNCKYCKYCKRVIWEEWTSLRYLVFPSIKMSYPFFSFDHFLCPPIKFYTFW